MTTPRRTQAARTLDRTVDRICTAALQGYAVPVLQLGTLTRTTRQAYLTQGEQAAAQAARALVQQIGIDMTTRSTTRSTTAPQ